MTSHFDCRLFPLPNLVLFPHALIPMHIFEPRYRQMTADALESDRLMTVVQIRSKLHVAPEPVPIMEVGCLGKIVEHRQLADGRYNLVLGGLKRVRLKREKSSLKLYRIAEGEILEDQDLVGPTESERNELVDLFRAVMEMHERLDQNLSMLIDSAIPVGILSDIIAHTLPLPPSLKQLLLSETDVICRVRCLRSILLRITEPERRAAGFPPPFSLN